MCASRVILVIKNVACSKKGPMLRASRHNCLLSIVSLGLPWAKCGGGGVLSKPQLKKREGGV